MSGLCWRTGRDLGLVLRTRLALASQKAFSSGALHKYRHRICIFRSRIDQTGWQAFFPHIYLDFITHALIFENIFLINRGAMGRRDSLRGHGDKGRCGAQWKILKPNFHEIYEQFSFKNICFTGFLHVLRVKINFSWKLCVRAASESSHGVRLAEELFCTHWQMSKHVR